jgi:hypothetical protein
MGRGQIISTVNDVLDDALGGVLDYACEVPLVPALVCGAERFYVLGSHACSSLVKGRKVGRATFGLALCARSWLFQAALPAAILCVVEVSTLKVRTTGSASR